jgi:hypothetical protein
VFVFFRFARLVFVVSGFIGNFIDGPFHPKKNINAHNRTFQSRLCLFVCLGLSRALIRFARCLRCSCRWQRKFLVFLVGLARPKEKGKRVNTVIMVHKAQQRNEEKAHTKHRTRVLFRPKPNQSE